jgi:hypothetical protein
VINQNDYHIIGVSTNLQQEKIVYIIGAGINQVVKHSWYDGLSPPMINNFFQTALKIERFATEFYSNQIQIVYDYIAKFWKKNKSDLSNGPFDLEECFTLIELQLKDAIDQQNQELAQNLRTIQFKLKLFLMEVLSEFSHEVLRSDPFREFGSILFTEKPIIITFNYDEYIENILEIAAGPNIARPPMEEIRRRHLAFMQSTELSEQELGYHFHNWTKSLAYGMKFDTVSWDFPGPEQLVAGATFYSHPNNGLYDWYLLKLHGSINWFRYLTIRAIPAIPGQEEPPLTEDFSQIIISRQSYWFNHPPILNGWFIDPIIITPNMYKERQLTETVFDKLATLWLEAKNALSSCNTLVVIGYSFPPTDFMTKKLFLESFSNHQLDELIIVNPDTSVVQKVKDLCHHNKPVIVCRDLSEYLRIKDTSPVS